MKINFLRDPDLSHFLFHFFAAFLRLISGPATKALPTLELCAPKKYPDFVPRPGPAYITFVLLQTACDLTARFGWPPFPPPTLQDLSARR